LETLHVENGMIGHRQTVERKQPEDSRQPCQEDRQLKSHRDKHWPAIQRAPTYIDRIIDDGGPILKVETADAADNAADQNNQRKPGLVKPNGFSKTVDGKWTVGVHPPVTFREGTTRGFEQSVRTIELGHQAVDCRRSPRFAFRQSHCDSSVSCTSSRISKIE